MPATVIVRPVGTHGVVGPSLSGSTFPRRVDSSGAAQPESLAAAACLSRFSFSNGLDIAFLLFEYTIRSAKTHKIVISTDYRQ
ncbi:unannotated protein [freshwater metagenome]|uniref:Unannotated protein n=1 Tax=freshwater metagenome TaxID=449393 RepID=A0A6J6SUC8_9ZZZZ